MVSEWRLGLRDGGVSVRVSVCIVFQSMSRWFLRLCLGLVSQSLSRWRLGCLGVSVSALSRSVSWWFFRLGFARVSVHVSVMCLCGVSMASWSVTAADASAVFR